MLGLAFDPAGPNKGHSLVLDFGQRAAFRRPFECVCRAAHASALDYRTRPVRIIVGFLAASATDVTVRRQQQEGLPNSDVDRPVHCVDIPGVKTANNLRGQDFSITKKFILFLATLLEFYYWQSALDFAAWLGSAT